LFSFNNNFKIIIFVKNIKLVDIINMCCGKKFKEKFYNVIKVKNGEIINGTIVDIVTIPNIPISNSDFRLYSLVDKTFTKDFPNQNLLIQRYNIKQPNSTSFFVNTINQMYDADTDSTISFTGTYIADKFIYIRPDGNYKMNITGANGKFEGATKLNLNIFTDTKTFEKQLTFTVTGYRPKC
jgi:hypothetical protein